MRRREGGAFGRSRPAAGALAVLAVLAFFTAACSRGPLRFAWLTDTHVGSDRGADDLRACVADINAEKGLRFVLVTGDITEMGSSDELALAKGVLDGLRVPYHIIPGNHDTKWSGSGGTAFARLWGDDRFVFKSGRWRFIGMHQGPVMKMGDGHWAPQDVRWLKRLLAGKAAETPTVFVTHYPLDASIANWYVVLDMLKDIPTAAVLVGHGHRNQALDFEGIPGAMGRSSLGTKDAAPGYTIVEMGPERMTFCERTAGRTLPPWHTIELAAGRASRAAGEAAVGGRNEGPGSTPRPDFSVNDAYPDVRVRWQVDSGWTIASSAILYGGTVVVGDASGLVRGLRAADGSPVWEFRTGGPVYSTPDAAEGIVVLASTDGTVRALDAASGRPLWSAHPGSGGRDRDAIVASPRIAAGSVFVGSSGGHFDALDLADGGALWRFQDVGGFVETRALVAGGLVVFGAWGGRLYALEEKTGRLAWTWQGERPSPFYAPAACWPVAAEGRVFIVAPDRRLTALDLATGRQVWRTDRWAVRESIGVSEDGRRVYVRTTQNIIAAVSAAGDTPEPVWETDAGFGTDVNSAQLVEKEGVLFYGTMRGLLVALDAATGAVKWKHRVGAGLLNTVTPLSAREVIVTDFDGRVTLVVQAGKDREEEGVESTFYGKN